MNIDLPHMAVTAAIIAIVVYLMNHVGGFKEMSNAKRSLLTILVLFVALFVLNLFWPYGA